MQIKRRRQTFTVRFNIVVNNRMILLKPVRNPDVNKRQPFLVPPDGSLSYFSPPHSMIAEKCYESGVEGTGLFQLLEEYDNSVIHFFRDLISTVAEIVDPRQHERWGIVKDGGEVYDISKYMFTGRCWTQANVKGVSRLNWEFVL